MSAALVIDMSGLRAEDMEKFRGELENRAGLHAKIAADGETFVKDAGKTIASGQHRTANTLGATPTGHLSQAYEGIEAQSDGDAAMLLVPRSSRLRAAFGPYTVEPKNGSTYLTIPAHKDAYGKRAREFPNLFYAEVGPMEDPVLARLKGFSAVRKGGAAGIAAQLEVMFALRTSVDIPEDPDLIPFEELGNEARDSAEAYYDEAIERHLT